MRTFIAIELPEELRARLDAQLARLRRNAPRARWVRADSLHLTLCFLGEVNDAGVPAVSACAAEVVRHHGPHLLRLQGGGVFGAMERPKVLWVALAGEVSALAALQAELSRALEGLGHVPEFDRFEPHITLARSSHPGGDEPLARCADALVGVDFGPFEVRELVVLSSDTGPEGMTYQAVSRHPLTPAPAPPPVLTRRVRRDGP